MTRNPSNPTTAAATTEPPVLLTVPQAAKLLCAGRSYLYELISSGDIKSISLRKRGNVRGKRLVSRESVLAFIQRHLDAAPSPAPLVEVEVLPPRHNHNRIAAPWPLA
jgi:excisionase family DNA binding protein